MASQNRLLMIAYHFPPCKGSSGIQRTLKFSQYLPAFGWQPSILTVNERAYENTSPEQLRDIPEGAVVTRAPALDTSRHLAVFGKYPRFFAVPDRWVSWWPGGVLAGLRLIRDQKPKAIWSTYPIATAHLIGHTLHRLTGLPWIADLRDPMAQEDYPRDPRVWRSFRRIETNIAANAAAICFTSPGAIEHYRSQNPTVDPSRLHLIENGYDEDYFQKVEKQVFSYPTSSRSTENVGPTLIVHSGTIYPSERDPRPLFFAIEQLKSCGKVSSDRLQIVLRATAHDNLLSQLIGERGIGDIVKLAPSVSYIDALAEMFEADGLLLLQASSCNLQIPAKVYEYIRSGKPILALTDPAGDTAHVILNGGRGIVANIHSSTEIADSLESFLLALNSRQTDEISNDCFQMSRYARTGKLAALLDRVSVRKLSSLWRDRTQQPSGKS